MKLIIIDRKAWERHCSDFADFIHRIEHSSAIRPKRTNGSTTKPCASVWASANAPCNPIEIREKSLSQWLDISAITKKATSRNYWTQKVNELWQRTKSLHSKTLRCSCFHNWWKEYWRNWSGIALLPVRVGWRGLPDRRGGVQTFTVESSHTSGLSGQWHDCLFKIGGKILYRQSDIQAMLERHYNPIPQTGKLWVKLRTQSRLKSNGQLWLWSRN